MTRKMRILEWILCALVPIMVIGGLKTISRDFREPNYQWPTQMAENPSYKAYEENPVFVNMATMQSPPEGTIMRGRKPFHFDTTEADRIHAGKTLANVFYFTDENALRRGKSVYSTFCQVCHGSTGAGDGPIIPKYSNPPSFNTIQAKERKDGEIFHIVTMGKGNMPSYGSQIDRQDIWKAILYIRTLQK